MNIFADWKSRLATINEGGALALPCRIQDPDRKGRVESGVGHAQRTPLKTLRFESLEEAQSYLDRWEAHWADTRIHGTTKRQVAAMFAEEKPALLPLPLEPFRYYQYGQRTVHLDGCVEVEAAYYGAPPGWIGRLVNVQWDDLWVRLLDPRTGQLLREHLRQKRGRYRIKQEDYPKRVPLGTSQLLAARVAPEPRSAPSANRFITSTANWVCAASWASWPWPRSSASRSWRTPARRLGISEFMSIALCGAIWSTVPKRP
jgi:hypothetical protein